MLSILIMSHKLLEVGQEYIENHRPQDGSNILFRLLNLPEVPPAVAARANFLIAQVQIQNENYEGARKNLYEALEQDPENAECHYLLAQTNDFDEEEGCQEEALEHYACACELSPGDGRIRSEYALKLARIEDPEKGLRILEETYFEHDSDPMVVENFALALIEANRLEEAEIVVTQASARNSGDQDFGDLRRRLEERFREERLFGPKQDSLDDGSPILPFPQIPQHKARGQKKPSSVSKTSGSGGRGGSEFEDELTSSPTPSESVVLGTDLTLEQVLKKIGSKYVSGLYENLGLLGKNRPHLRRVEVLTVLLQRAFLNSMIKRLPADSRKLLRTVTRAGGYIPASVLFQNTGPDAPLPDFVQPLLQHGLLYFGREPRPKSRTATSLVAVIPIDLLQRLATVLRIEMKG